jgi:membrane protease YdiL (CAAX protease family)
MKQNREKQRSKSSKKEQTGMHPLSLRSILKQRDPESSLILFLVPIILTIWVYYGKQADFDTLFKGFEEHWNQDLYSTIYEYLTAFLLMFGIPYFYIKMVFKGRLKDYGIQIGDRRYGFRFVLITVPFILWAVYIGSSNSSVQAAYPMARSVIGHPLLFLLVEVFYIIYYIAWEFLFRGFMLFGLERRFGAFTAILIQAIPSAIVHIGKPAGESFGAIIVGLVFGYLAIRTRSILYPCILHATIGIGTDLFVTFRLP